MMRNAAPEKAGVVVVRAKDDVWRFLLVQANGLWGFPKGHIEPSETPLAAAKREVCEETTIADLDFRWGNKYLQTEPCSGHLVTRYFVAVSLDANVALPVSPELGKPENDQFLWATLDQGKALIAPRLQLILSWADGVIRNETYS